MKARTFFLVALSVVLLAALPGWSQDIPAGDDTWNSVGGGATYVTLTAADWKALCGAAVPDTALQLVGQNIPGLGTADTVVTRLDNASFGSGSTASVRIQLKQLSMVSDGSHPCSPLTIRVTQDTTQSIGKMVITRTSAAGGTFTAQVPVAAVVQAVDGSGVVKGSTYLSGSLGDDSTSPWAYGTYTGTAAMAGARHKATAVGRTSPWTPGVDPATKQPVRICRYGTETLPAWHCYQPIGDAGGTVKAVQVDQACTVSSQTAN